MEKQLKSSARFKNNPRKISEEQFARLRDNLAELGDLSGIVYCRNAEALVGGNQRAAIMENSQITITQEFDEPQADQTIATGVVFWNGNQFSYREVEFTNEQFLKANIVANAAGGEFDFEILTNDDCEATTPKKTNETTMD